MIDSLYEPFQRWSAFGSVYLISDTHFDDEDCKIMDKDWISPMEHIEKIKKCVNKNDTLICLGDVGNPAYMNLLKCYKVLIMGNHDEAASRFANYFDEIYKGPLMVGEKIILSHEPIDLDWALNIHGHVHTKGEDDLWHMNIAANVVNFEVINLGKIIKAGRLKNIKSLHRKAIDNAGMAKGE